MLENYLTKSDFVRIIWRGPSNVRETIWLAAYHEGLIDVPLLWHLAIFQIDVGMPIVRFLGRMMSWITRCLLTSAAPDPPSAAESGGDSEKSAGG